MNWFGRGSRLDGLGEMAAIMWMFILILLGIAIAAFYFAWQAPVEKAELAAQLMRIGWLSGGTALAIIIANWAWHKWLDR